MGHDDDASPEPVVLWMQSDQGQDIRLVQAAALVQEAILYHEKWVAYVLAWGTMPLSRFKSMLHVKQGEPSPLDVAVDALKDARDRLTRIASMHVADGHRDTYRTAYSGQQVAALRALGVDDA